MPMPVSACRKSMFFQKKCLFPIPIPKPLSPGERLCMLGWLCIVQSPCAYTPGIRAGAILLGLPPLDPVGGYAPATPFLYNQEVYRQSETDIGKMPMPVFIFSLTAYLFVLTVSTLLHEPYCLVFP